MDTHSDFNNTKRERESKIKTRVLSSGGGGGGGGRKLPPQTFQLPPQKDFVKEFFLPPMHQHFF